MTRHPVRGLLPVFLLALLAAPVACQAGAARADAPKRHALLIGIDRYACVSREQEQLQGADEDVERMALLLRACGFRIHTLPGSAAPTGANIRQALAALGAQAGAGDEVVFYFSGRGSVAKAVPEGDEGPEPTLVPADGLADSARADLRMGELEAWASDLNKKDVRLTLILDTCFTSPTARGEERAWKNVPRCLIRGRPVRPRGTLYRGAGLLLSPGNQAYEWQLDVDTNAWSGAFTHLWTNAAMARLQKDPDKIPTFGEILDEVRAFFVARPGYMRGQGTYAAGATDRLAEPLFSLTSERIVAPDKAQAEAKQRLEAVVQENRAKEKKLRVALEAGDPSAKDEERDALLAEARGVLARRFAQTNAHILILPPFADRPDRIVYLKRATEAPHRGMLVAEVVGDEWEQWRNKPYVGADMAAVLKAGLETYLERQALVLRLFHLTENPESRTLPLSWSARSDKPLYTAGDFFSYVVDAGKAVGDGGEPPLLYILDRDDADGIVQLSWPSSKDWDNRLAERGAVQIPRVKRYRIHTVGRTAARAVLVAPSKPLPPLQPPAGGEWKEDAAYGAAEAVHLKALLDALEAGKARWAVIHFDYKVTEKK